MRQEAWNPTIAVHGRECVSVSNLCLKQNSFLSIQTTKQYTKTKSFSIHFFSIYVSFEFLPLKFRECVYFSEDMRKHQNASPVESEGVVI